MGSSCCITLPVMLFFSDNHSEPSKTVAAAACCVMWHRGEEFSSTILVNTCCLCYKYSLSIFRQLLDHAVLTFPVYMPSTEPCAKEQPGRWWVKRWEARHGLGCASLLLCMAASFLLRFHCSHGFYSKRYLLVGLRPQEGGCRAVALLAMPGSWTGTEVSKRCI